LRQEECGRRADDAAADDHDIDAGGKIGVGVNWLDAGGMGEPEGTDLMTGGGANGG